MHCGARPCLFFLSLILPFCSFDATQTMPCGRCSWCVSYAPAVSLATAGHCRSCMPCKMSRTSSRLARSCLCGPLASSNVLLSQHGHRCNNSRLSCCFARPQTRQSFLASNLCIASLRPIRPQLLDGLRASLPTSHHLVGGIFRTHLRHHWALARATIRPSFFFPLVRC